MITEYTKRPNLPRRRTMYISERSLSAPRKKAEIPLLSLSRMKMTIPRNTTLTYR